MITLKRLIEILLTSVMYCLGYRLSHFHVGKAVLRQSKYIPMEETDDHLFGEVQMDGQLAGHSVSRTVFSLF